MDHGGSVAVSSGPGWNDPPAAALIGALAKSKNATKTSTVSSITSPITQPLAMAPEQPQQQPPMNFGAQQGYHYPDQSSYDQQQPYGQVAAPPPPVNMMQPQVCAKNIYLFTLSGQVSLQP